MREGFELYDSVTLSSTLENLSKIESLVDKICLELDIHSDIYGNVLIAVTEAFNNAVYHGNKNDTSMNVSVNVLCSNNAVVISIADEGKGFDFTNLPDPIAPENLERENGRGIFLMKNLADEVEFKDSGKVVDLLFNKN